PLSGEAFYSGSLEKRSYPPPHANKNSPFPADTPETGCFLFIR
ncbi:hypothetical protein RUMCAL_02853, partial [Ruminococcus callidus ATCC 27760]